MTNSTPRELDVHTKVTDMFYHFEVCIDRRSLKKVRQKTLVSFSFYYQATRCTSQ